MQPNKHKYDHDLTNLIPPTLKVHRNPLLQYIEAKPIPPKKGRGAAISQRQKDFQEALQLMVPCQDSLLIEKRDFYHITRSAKKLGYRITHRVEDNRGIKLYRFWVVAQTLQKDQGER